MQNWKRFGLVLVTAIVSIASVRLLDAGNARAQAAGYHECFFAQQEYVDIDNNGTVATPDAAHSIHVPAGWSVAGGAANAGGGIILLCR